MANQHIHFIRLLPKDDDDKVTVQVIDKRQIWNTTTKQHDHVEKVLFENKYSERALPRKLVALKKKYRVYEVEEM